MDKVTEFKLKALSVQLERCILTQDEQKAKSVYYEYMRVLSPELMHLCHVHTKLIPAAYAVLKSTVAAMESMIDERGIELSERLLESIITITGTVKKRYKEEE